MVETAGRFTGLGRRAADVLTEDQVRLHWHFSQRERAREQRIDEITMTRAIARTKGIDV